MSQTISPGRVGSSHWTYIAAAMAASLRKGKSDPPSAHKHLLKGVYDAARRFLQVALEAIEPGQVPTNPAASIANYSVAVQALENSVQSTTSDEQLKSLLRTFARVIEEINPDAPSPEPSADTDLLESLAHFFAQIAADGEREAYEQYSGIGEGPPMFR